MVPPQLVADPVTTGVTVALMLQLPVELFVKVRFGKAVGRGAMSQLTTTLEGTFKKFPGDTGDTLIV